MNHLGEMEEAVRLYEKALEQSPDSLEALVGLGTILHGQGKADSARGLYQRALQVEPHLVTYPFGLPPWPFSRVTSRVAFDAARNMLRTLGLPFARTLESLTISRNFSPRCHTLDQAGREDLSGKRWKSP